MRRTAEDTVREALTSGALTSGDWIRAHDSDVPSELAARHDLVLAIHQTRSTSGITIAFPQMVVWSGESAATPYPSAAERIRTKFPGLGGTTSGSKRRAVSWRRSVRRSGDDAT